MSLHQMDLDDMLEDERPEPGRELDALVAEHVMGWYWNGDMLGPPPGDRRAAWAAEWDSDGIPHYLPKYTTDPSASSELLSRLESTFESIDIKFSFGQWYCLLQQYNEDGTWSILSSLYTGDSSMFKAICFSALEAFGIDIEGVIE